MAQVDGFAQYARGLQKTISAAPTKKPNSIVAGYQKRAQKAFDSIPDQLNAQSAAEEAERLAQENGQAPREGLSADENSSRAQSNIANTPEQINTPQAVDNQVSSSFDSIGQIGKAATNAQNMRFASERRASPDGSGAPEFPDMGFEGGVGGGPIQGLSAEQSQNAQAIANEGRRRGMNENDIQTAIMTALAESGLRNVNYGDRDSVGLFQQRTSQGWGTINQIMNPQYSAGKFYEGLSNLKGRQNMTPWQQAQGVQRSAFADGSNYRAQFEKAKQITQAIVSAPVMKYNGSAEWINTHTNWYGDYDSAYAMQCVDLYNFYTSGFAGGNPMMGSVRGAVDIWNNHDPRAYTRLARFTRPQMGDVAVFNRGGGFDPNYGHVGIVAQYNPNGTIRVLNANATSAGPTARTVMSNFSTSNVIGYLRPRKLMGAR